jgi:hypothetical protein
MKTLLIVLLLFVGCSSVPKNPESWLEFEKNACLPTAIVYKKSLEKDQIWGKIVSYQYHNQNLGHAIATYLYPPGQNKLWTYDYLGSYRARAYVDNPLQIARECEKKRGRDPNNVLSAYFID